MIYYTVASAPVTPLGFGFFTPLFNQEHSNALYVQHFTSDFIVRRFDEIDEFVPGIRFDCPRYAREVGQEAILGFSDGDGHQYVGTRNELAPVLLDAARERRGSYFCSDVQALLGHRPSTDEHRKGPTSTRKKLKDPPPRSGGRDTSVRLIAAAAQVEPETLDSLLLGVSAKEVSDHPKSYSSPIFYIEGRNEIASRFGRRVHEMAYEYRGLGESIFPSRWMEHLPFLPKRQLTSDAIDAIADGEPVHLDYALSYMGLINAIIRADGPKNTYPLKHMRIDTEIFGVKNIVDGYYYNDRLKNIFRHFSKPRTVGLADLEKAILRHPLRYRRAQAVVEELRHVLGRDWHQLAVEPMYQSEHLDLDLTPYRDGTKS